jgi:hypothetical protein
VIDDELTAEERAELHASLDRALEDSEAGRQHRFDTEDSWWRQHRDAKELFVTTFTMSNEKS